MSFLLLSKSLDHRVSSSDLVGHKTLELRELLGLLHLNTFPLSVESVDLTGCHFSANLTRVQFRQFVKSLLGEFLDDFPFVLYFE